MWPIFGTHVLGDRSLRSPNHITVTLGPSPRPVNCLVALLPIKTDTDNQARTSSSNGVESPFSSATVLPMKSKKPTLSTSRRFVTPRPTSPAFSDPSGLSCWACAPTWVVCLLVKPVTMVDGSARVTDRTTISLVVSGAALRP